MIKTKLINAYFTFIICHDILNLKNKRFSKRQYLRDKLKIFYFVKRHKINAVRKNLKFVL